MLQKRRKNIVSALNVSFSTSVLAQIETIHDEMNFNILKAAKKNATCLLIFRLFPPHTVMIFGAWKIIRNYSLYQIDLQ